MAATALPYLSRPVHRLVSFLIALAVLAAVCGGQALPVNAVSSVALGWGVAAGLHLAVGSPLGLPSAAEITEWIADLNVTVADITRAPRQVWGVEQFTGRDPAGEAIELAVYGRDASDARVLAKLWRFFCTGIPGQPRPGPPAAGGARGLSHLDGRACRGHGA